MSDPVPETFQEWLIHSVQRSVSVYLIGAVVAIVVFFGWTFYRAFLQKAQPTQTIQHADVVDSRQFHQTFGCLRVEAIRTQR